MRDELLDETKIAFITCVNSDDWYSEGHDGRIYPRKRRGIHVCWL